MRIKAFFLTNKLIKLIQSSDVKKTVTDGCIKIDIKGRGGVIDICQKYRRLPFFDDVSVWLDSVKIWLPLIQRLRLRRVIRTFNLERLEQTLNKE